MKCEHCGTTLRKESMFCWECGKAVNAKSCYLKELKSYTSILTRKTDIDSMNVIIDLTEKIFNRTNENPKLIYNARAFFENYLPILCSVLGKYRDIKKGNIKDESIGDIENELTDTLNVTEKAFDILLKELYEKDIMDIEIDLKLLKTLIARDGRKGSDFEPDMTE